MKIAIDLGHGTGDDRGSIGYLNEEKIIREYGPLVIEGLKKLGHTIINVTPTKSNLTLAQSLAYRVNMANSNKVDLLVSLHVNAFEKDRAKGCEVEYISPTGKGLAEKICSEISKLGYVNRGPVKRENLYILKHTSMPSILVEPFFCDNKEDCDKYNPLSIANSIIKGLTGQYAFVEKNEPTVPNIDYSIPSMPGVYSLPGGIGYIQVIKEKGRIDIHLDKYNYITIQDSEIEGNRIILTTRTKGSKILL
ncbi:N-acetylmuramoyl-L-alanine amidase [Clostridium sp. MSJ-11]|uniref:N-acetylmuramoyl-L-alanine amidase n=1 Tax=Clostridium mobile TaxID=2841512 RepID=A0ABS6ECE6_9CLOT|nr:N-acetylmuramoyl-L-alanine amidase [Clostridium mobile]MBU5482864.1 N-acetylmuramoyl-L-alanine amidase [Clostridium mobile]